jgi:hypothetical protein
MKKFELKKRTGIIFILLINLILVVGLLLIGSYLAEQRLPKTRAQFLSIEDLSFYKKYSSQLNHLRDFEFLKKLYPGTTTTRSDYLFSKIGDGKTQVLLQGDSWAEQFLTSSPSFFTLQNFAENKDLSLIVAGTTSYSPSVMQTQYRILRQDFGLAPKIVVGVIDQTDIGDELCRYKSQLAMNQEGEQIVKPYTGSTIVPYHLEAYFRAVDILDSAESALVRLLKYKIAKLTPAQLGGCGHEILSPLAGILSQPDRDYFIDRVSKYIDEIFKSFGDSPKPQSLILVTHFHKKHISKEYQTNVADLVAIAIKQSKYRAHLSHVNFTPERYKDENLNTIFVEGDGFSHLTEFYHRKIFTQQILKKIEEVLIRIGAVTESGN